MAPVVMTEIVYATIDTTDPTAPVNIDFLNLGCTQLQTAQKAHIDSHLNFYDLKLSFR